MDQMDINAIRDSITCPITSDVMTDPVQGNDGHTYERSAIIEWLSRNPISPQTRQPMNINDLKVNASIRFLCDKYHNGAFGSMDIKDRPNAKISNDKITMDHTIYKNSEHKTMMVFNVNPNNFPKDLENGHLPQDIVLVIDHSGSMNMAVQAKDSDGNTLENGMSVQDIVNHAAKTVTKTLSSNCRLAVIIFDNVIEVLIPLTLMNEMNKSSCLTKIDNIKPRNQTNIWGGYTSALNLLDERDDKSRNSAILLFTDGYPNVSPARGEVETLKKLRKKTNYSVPLYTFGFGYSLKRDLLYDMAKYANGANGHIPDGGMIATVFCNFTGTILSTVILNLQLYVKFNNPDEECPINFLMGDYAFNKNEDTGYTVFDIGTVQHEQSRNIVLNTNSSSNFSYYYTYEIGGQLHKSDEVTIDSAIYKTISINDIEIDTHINRYSIIEECRKMINYNNMGNNTISKELFDNLVSKVETSKSKDMPLTVGLLTNLKGNGNNAGQISLAINNPEYFCKWGEFYIDQLTRSMNQQIKPNFKDEGCPFGGLTFENIVDCASDIFDTLPPPKPSLINNLNYNNRNSYTSLSNNNSTGYTNVATLAGYNNRDGGCFDSKCKIRMANGCEKLLSDLKQNDCIQSIDRDGNITTANVVCILEMKIKTGIREFVDLPGGLYITPWHPVKYNGEWVFPANIKDPIIRSTRSIITLVLDKHHVGFINGYQCIMLGHGFTDSILEHPYYGTELVINDLKENYGWYTGKVVMCDTDVKFIKEKNKIVKMTYDYTRSVTASAALVETY